jgi:hypothetical protein
MTKNRQCPIEGLETAAAAIADLQARLEDGDNDPSEADLSRIGETAWSLVALIQLCMVARSPMRREDPARERPIMLGKRGLGRL